MKALGLFFGGVAAACGLCGLWIAMASVGWCAFQAWTWDIEDELEIDEEAL